MADIEQLKILKQGVEIWNQWRENNSYITINLSFADLRKVNLRRVNLSEANLSQANLSQANLSEADLKEANLSETNLSEADLREADLSKANLSRANLTRTQALKTNFNGATLTEACIEDWNTNNQTNLKNITCDYIYLKKEYNKDKDRWELTERLPHNPNKNFELGEFTKLFQKVLETVDLRFLDGVNWEAAACSIKNTQIMNKDTPLAIKSIENQEDGVILIKLGVPKNTDKGKIEGDFWQSYEFAQKTLKQQIKQDY